MYEKALSAYNMSGDIMAELKRYVYKGILFVSIVGIIWHFVYEWTGRNLIVGLFCPVSESTWEHMKLIFFPMILYSLYMNRKLKSSCPGIMPALLAGILTGTFLIPVIFYTYSGILGENYVFFDIAAFLGSVVCAFLAVYRLSLCHKKTAAEFFLKIAVCAVMICFFLFTYYPPGLGIFINPVKHAFRSF